MRKVKKGDRVKITAGNDRGKEGEVLKVFPAEDKVVVENINMITRHQRPTARQREGGIIEQEGSVHVSNVLPICPECGKPTRAGFKILENGEKLRLCKKCGQSFS